jgi:hypothetical protein
MKKANFRSEIIEEVITTHLTPMLKQVIRNVPNDYDDLKFVTDTMFSVM